MCLRRLRGGVQGTERSLFWGLGSLVWEELQNCGQFRNCSSCVIWGRKSNHLRAYKTLINSAQLSSAERGAAPAQQVEAHSKVFGTCPTVRSWVRIYCGLWQILRRCSGVCMTNVLWFINSFEWTTTTLATCASTLSTLLAGHVPRIGTSDRDPEPEPEPESGNGTQCRHLLCECCKHLKIAHNVR